MLHNHLRNTPTPAPPQSRAGMLPGSQRPLGTMDPSLGCSSHRPEPHFFPLAAPWAGVSEQGRAGVSRAGGLLTPRARSCGCASCSTFLRLRLRLPPGSLRLGRGVSCRANGTTPRTMPSNPPRAPPSMLGMVQRGGARHNGCAKHQVRPSPSSSSCAKAFPGVEVSQGTLAMPTPCPGWVASLAPGSPHFCFRSDASPGAQLLGGAELGAPSRAGSPFLGCSPHPATLPEGCPQPPSPRWPHSRRDVLPPRALETAAAFPRSLRAPPGRRRRRTVPTTPRGCRCRCWGCPRPPVPAP